jgi:hypothetical protein
MYVAMSIDQSQQHIVLCFVYTQRRAYIMDIMRVLQPGNRLEQQLNK